MQRFHLQIKTLTLIVRIDMDQHKLGYVPNSPSVETQKTPRLAWVCIQSGTRIAIHWHITPM